ncbi:MAG: histidine phosphatase family protein [Eubacteriales bacterium]|nr:histidine phosphatase family protein [Eubacteriales bacterium]
MTSIYFIRHAEPNYENHDDRQRELSEKGMADRKLVTRYLSGIPVDVVLSSPFRRAVDTISDFAETYGYGIELVEDFRERKVDSDWIDNFYEFSKRQWEDFDYKLSDGETLREVQNRNIGALMKVLERYPGKTVVVGSHGTALSTIINYFHRDFGFEEFEKMRTLMPWVVCFHFKGQQCVKIRQYDVFTKQTKEVIDF